MTIEVKKKKGESPESLLRRFTKQVQQSGLVLQVKKTQYLNPAQSREKIKKTAKRRTKLNEKREYLKKIGKIIDPADSFGNKKYRR
ncbi:MAG: 30S ribosomal protein S21 [Candidatus Kuenenbacteria bacterium]